MSTYNEMKKKAESDQNRIELRSEKVRNMIFQEMNVGISSVFLIFVF